VTIAQIDEDFTPVPGTEKSFACDTVLIAVGLDPVNEFSEKAARFGMTVLDAGDAQEIAEASAAMFTGKIAGRKVARALGHDVEIPQTWHRTAEILKSHPGHVVEERIPRQEGGVFPVFHCSQEIPCNPCTAVCPQDLIHIPGDDIRQLPEFLGPHVEATCVGCEQCITVCPGLAITLVDYRKDAEWPTVAIPYEFSEKRIAVGDTVTVLDRDGQVLGDVEVVHVRATRRNDHTVVVKVKAPTSIAKRIAGIRAQEPWVSEPLPETVERLDDNTIICRCERVTAGEIRALIRQGYRDVNEIKAVTRAGMGACGSKTCAALIHRLFREEGIPLDDVEENTKRPLFVEVPLGVFAGTTDRNTKRDA
jgi:ferredoxin